MTIPVAGPSITKREIDYVTDAVTNAWYGQHSTYHVRFESAFADYLGVRHAIALPSCTAALHLSLAALGIGLGDEVVVPEITWIATSAPIDYVGATPVFADIDPRTWCLSADSFKQCITPRTKAVIPVDLYGNIPDMDTIRSIAQEHGIAVIEDAAEAIGSEYKGRKAGALGDVGVFSFHGSKTLTTGEGGMLVTDHDEVADRVRVLMDHGRSSGEKLFWNAEVAYKYKLSSMQAALGLAQLERIESLLEKKRTIFEWYQQELSGLDVVQLNEQAPFSSVAFWMVTILVDPALGIEKERLIALLRERGIDSRPFFYPLSSLPAYADRVGQGAAILRNEVSYRLSPYGVNLPSALSLTRSQVEVVCSALSEVLRA